MKASWHICFTDTHMKRLSVQERSIHVSCWGIVTSPALHDLPFSSSPAQSHRLPPSPVSAVFTFFQFLVFFLIILFIYLGCPGSSLLLKLFSNCSARASHCGGLSCCGEQALECSGFSSCSSQAPEHRVNRFVLHGLGCSVACGIFPDQGSNLRLLYWQVDSLPLSRQGSLLSVLLTNPDPSTQGPGNIHFPPPGTVCLTHHHLRKLPWVLGQASDSPLFSQPPTF